MTSNFGGMSSHQWSNEVPSSVMLKHEWQKWEYSPPISRSRTHSSIPSCPLSEARSAGLEALANCERTACLGPISSSTTSTPCTMVGVYCPSQAHFQAFSAPLYEGPKSSRMLGSTARRQEQRILGDSQGRRMGATSAS